MIHLRELRPDDAPLMLEWMHDPSVQKGLRKDMLHMTLEQAESFCKNAKLPAQPAQGDSVHFAIADEQDEYLGTISLKNLDFENRHAEYAITIRSKMHNKGIGTQATRLLFEKAFGDYSLHKVYLEVLDSNPGAIHMYEKSGFQYTGEFREHLFLRGEYQTLKLYEILDRDYLAKYKI